MQPMIRVFMSCLVMGALLGSYQLGTATTPIRPIPVEIEAETIEEEEELIVVERHIEKSTEVEETVSEIPVVETEQKIQTYFEETSPIEETFYEEPITTEILYYSTDQEIDLIAQLTMAEVGNQPEYTQRLVIDTILNRRDSSRFPNSVYEVIYSPGQYDPVSNGFLYQCYVRDDIRQLVIEELANRTNYDVIYFNDRWYCSYGVPITQVGPVYFSGCQY